jgi:integrase
VTQRHNLYRRPSGIYVLRITIPARYRSKFLQREIHASTQTTELSGAKAVALRLLEQWHSCISGLDQLNETKVIEGSPLLAGAGFISIHDFCETFEVEQKLVLQEVLNNNIPIACRLKANLIWVDDYTLVDRDGIDGFVLNSAFEQGVERAFAGYLKPFHRGYTISNLIEHGFSDETAFRYKKNSLAAAFCDLPGIRLTSSSVFITKVQAERIRDPWVKALRGKTALLTAPSVSGPTPGTRSSSVSAFSLTGHPSSPPTKYDARFCNPKFSGMLASDLLDKFLKYKAPEWGLDQKKKMTTLCGCFVDLMNNPELGAIDREFIRQYEAKLKRMPANRYLAARRHGTNDAAQLLQLADKNNEQRLSAQSVESYVNKLSEFFRWAVTEDYLSKNPAENISQKARGAKKRAQDSRDQFGKGDLEEIFSAEWFQKGGAKRNKTGGLSSFRPYYYWLPLIGLYSGARLNEISQLYLDDIVEYGDGKFYFFINDAIPDSANNKNPIKASDKSIKNGNSKRVIPIHSFLIGLGLIDYARTLKSCGESRLFPELRYDEVKGYGKAAGRWFNEHFLGKQLNFERDGMKTYHSFRHTFITALNNNAAPEHIISSIAGHERGETMSLKHYGKDDAERLRPYIESLNFDLPIIQPFKVLEGIAAIKQAVHRRRRAPNRQ